GRDLPGATNSTLTLTLTNVGSLRTGTCSVIVSNTFGSVRAVAADLSFLRVVAWGSTTVPGSLTNDNVSLISANLGYHMALLTDGSIVGSSRANVPPGLANIIAISA